MTRLEAIFQEAVALTSRDTREAFLLDACGADGELRRSLDQLLAAHDDAQHLEFLPGASRAISSVAPGSDDHVLSVTERSGDRIGRYKLLEQIGEGGMGTVWMAEQEEPVRRRVALKIIKLGMDTREVVARFDAERQALAMMDHPNIAKVFDGGATGSGQSEISNLKSEIPKGRPYFVMELVRGLPITNYCDETKLSIRERLELFGQVCRAVQHAHQKGIIHRDLKPSNILVTEQDGRPVPKVIDFGIAKATEGRLTEKTLFTRFQQLIGTPAYMSPEQAGLGGLDIDTRSDTYSLGVVLYELLTGRPPFDTQELLKSGYEAVLRTIRETEPVKPSTRLKQERFVRRGTAATSEIGNQKSEIDNDLDWIVMKCLEKDRARRYDTPTALALDLDRYIHNEPVLARPPSRLYAFQRLVHRNKLAFASAASVLLALVAGLGFSTLSLARERAARERARIEAVRSGQVARFLKDMLSGVAPSVALGRDTKMLREILDNTAKRLAEDLKNQPEVEAELRLTLGKTYQELAQFPEALAMMREALRLRQSIFGPVDPAVAEVLNSLGAVLYDQGDLAGAEAVGREALAMREKLSGPENPDVAAALNNLGNVLQTRHKLTDAEATHRRALAMRRKLLGNADPDVARSLNGLANVLQERGDLAGAEPLYREALAIFKTAGDVKPILTTVMHNLAILLGRQGDLAAAEAIHREVLELRQNLLSSEHPNVAVTLNELAMVLAAQGKIAEAESRVHEALGISALKRDNWRFSTTLNTWAIVLGKKGDLAAAEAQYCDAIELRKKLLTPRHPMVAESLNGLAYLLAARGDLAGAETNFIEALAIKKEEQGNEHPDLIATLWPLSWVRRQQGDLAEAESLHREALSLSLQRGALGVGTLIESIYDLSDLLRVQGKFTEAEPLLREAFDYLQNNRSANEPFRRGVLERLVSFYDALGNPEQAGYWREKLLNLPAKRAVKDVP